MRAFLQIRSPERCQAVLEYVKANEILTSIADGFYALDANWRFVYFNDPAEILLKLSREKVMGRPFFDVFPEVLESSIHDNYQRVMDERTPLQFEANSSVPERWTSYSVYPTRDGGFSVYFRDISERKRIEGQIAEARNEAERANHAKSKFLAAASHDLRQPVQSLVLLMALVERQIAPNPETRETLAMLRKAIGGLENLLTAILDISRLDAGAAAHPEPVDLAAMLQGLALEYKPKADHLGLGLAIVSRIARLLGADIEVSSKVGRGSRFSLLLSAAEAPRAEDDEAAAAFEDRGGRVLIVEDNAIVLKSLEASLAQWGYETVTATTGEEALRVAEGERWMFGAIVTDQHLGAGMTGLETAKEIVRRSERYLPAVILTGDTSRQGISEIVASGFKMIRKPIAAEPLRRSLAMLLSGS